jgi:hypothetical protein
MFRRFWTKRPVTVTDTTAPTISGAGTVALASTSTDIEWSLSEPGTGLVEYGTTIDYGSSATFEEDFLTYHRQTITGLTAGTLYYFRITSLDVAGNDVTYESTFTTSGTLTPVLTIFGPGVAANTSAAGGKENVRMTEGAVAIRFTAHESAQVSYVGLPMTNRTSSYGAGNGGTYKVGIQSLTSGGLPSGTWLGTPVTQATPIITSPASWSKRWNMSAGPTLVAGTKYAIVIENVAASPNSNWSSYNIPWNPQDRATPWLDQDDVQLMLGNATYSSPFVYITSGSSKFLTFPSFDLAFASGGHEGFAGINARDDGLGDITSSSTCTWKWTHYAGHHGTSITFSTVGLLCYRISGTTDMTVNVKKNGVSQATGTFLTSSDLGTTPSSAYNWIEATLSGNVTAAVGDVMEVDFAVASGAYQAQVILSHESGTTTDQRMLSLPFEGSTTTRHQALENGSFIFPSWGNYSTLMTYVRLV